MPSLRQKVVGFFSRQLAAPSESSKISDKKDVPSPSKCFIQRYLSGEEEGKEGPQVIHGRTPQQLVPVRRIATISHDVVAATTGPHGGLTTVNTSHRHLSISDPDVHFIDNSHDETGGKDANSNTSTLNCNLIASSSGELSHDTKCETDCIAGVSDWNSATSFAHGLSVSLYERHPVTGVAAGEPIADCFGLVARGNSAILCLADGVNWGTQASLAARAAVHGCLDYLNRAIPNFMDLTTTDAFIVMLRSFSAAHQLILEEKGMLTTLTTVLVLPLADSPSKYIACACNVGDSLAYVYSPKHGVREITQGSHDVNGMRDMRDALGALGPVDGTNPELGNLTCAMTDVEPGDIIFITSDGISDNLDPVVGKFTGMGGVEGHQRHKLGLLRMEDLVKHGVSGSGPPASSARELSTLLVDFVTRLTAAKRRLLEQPDLYPDGDGAMARSRRKHLCAKLQSIPGKLDHASVVAYMVPHSPVSAQQTLN